MRPRFSTAGLGVEALNILLASVGNHLNPSINFPNTWKQIVPANLFSKGPSSAALLDVRRAVKLGRDGGSAK